METTVHDIHRSPEAFVGSKITLYGWVRNNRAQKEFGFINFHDGTFFEHIQVVYEAEKLDDFKDVQKIRVGSAIELEGHLVLTPGARQPFEIKATSVVLLGDSPENYPIQPKRHSREFLREVAHLRTRTNLFMRPSGCVASRPFIHEFFQKSDSYTSTRRS